MKSKKFSPPKAYWKELDTLDESVFGLSEVIGDEVVMGRTVTNVRAAWRPRDGRSIPVGWFGMKDQRGTRFMARLALSEDVESLVGLEDENLVTIYKYSIPLHSLRVGHVMLDALTDGPGNVELTADEQALENSIGDIVGEDSYDVLIEEMRRGASGDYAVPFR
ncbi:MAG TPA: hypothetical protein VF572_06460 [Candidatus Saccharimonadales bacterium]|jgi:hypothetical protein